MRTGTILLKYLSVLRLERFRRGRCFPYIYLEVNIAFLMGFSGIEFLDAEQFLNFSPEETNFSNS
jgi:hypothetical protein